MIKEELYENCISRRAVLDKIKEVCFSNEQKWIDFRASQGSNGQRDFIIEFIKALPPVTPQSKTGHWVKEKSLYGWDGKSYQCSECGRNIHLDLEVEELNDYPYCHCGAKMESEGKNG